MTIYFTSDHHFGHANIIKFCNRPFDSVEEMDNDLIEKWNLVVRSGDVVYHLGDFTLKGIKEFKYYCSQLNGYLRIIPGGHDHRWLRKFTPTSTKTAYCTVFPPLHTLKLNPPIVLCHYAMRVWDRFHYGSWHLYGHSHGNLPPHGLSLDVGVDNNRYIPLSWEHVLIYMNKRSEKFTT